jgi:hypothetical protein
MTAAAEQGSQKGRGRWVGGLGGPRWFKTQNPGACNRQPVQRRALPDQPCHAVHKIAAGAAGAGLAAHRMGGMASRHMRKSSTTSSTAVIDVARANGSFESPWPKPPLSRGSSHHWKAYLQEVGGRARQVSGRGASSGHQRSGHQCNALLCMAPGPAAWLSEHRNRAAERAKRGERQSWQPLCARPGSILTLLARGTPSLRSRRAGRRAHGRGTVSTSSAHRGARRGALPPL